MYFSLPYTEKTKTPLLRFKYGIDRSILSIIPALMPDIPEVDVIIPVPLHLKRLKSRGFNQSSLIALEIKKYIKAPVITDAAIRVKNTEPLTGLDKSKRSKEIKGAFSVSGSFKNKRVLLVDDVYTTGSTIKELAREIRKKKPLKILVYTLFRRY